MYLEGKDGGRGGKEGALRGKDGKLQFVCFF